MLIKDKEDTIDTLFKMLADEEVEIVSFSGFLSKNKKTIENSLSLIYIKTRKLSQPDISLPIYRDLQTYFIDKDISKTPQSIKYKLNFIKKNYQTIFYNLYVCVSLASLDETTNDSEIIHWNTNDIDILKRQQKKLNDENNKLQSKFEEQEKLKKQQEQNIENKIKSNVYSEVITILGIFTAITFAIFGGMNLLSNLFKNIGSTTTSLGQTLILAAVFGLIMWGIIELLFYWISKIKGITEGITDSTKDKHKILFNWIAIIVLAGILILGVFLFIKK